MVIFISVSGNSENIIRGAKFCKSNKIQSFSLTGLKKNNKLNMVSDNFIWINSSSYNQTDIIHHMILLISVDILIGRDVYKTNL